LQKDLKAPISQRMTTARQLLEAMPGSLRQINHALAYPADPTPTPTTWRFCNRCGD
jgi:hypothetical protein